MSVTNRRAIGLTAVFLLFSAWLGLAARPVNPPAQRPLAELPLEIDGWKGREGSPLDSRVLAVLGADDHVNRFYSRDPTTLALYIGYHRSQQQDDSIHSPMNCLPGAGWVATRADRIEIDDPRTPGRAARVNRVVVQKGEHRQLALYWYQSRGQIVASEYASKLQLFTGALLTGRSDAGLVRIMMPIADGTEVAASREAAEFGSVLLHTLDRHIPK